MLCLAVAEDAGIIQIPIGWLLTIGSGLVSAIVFIFWQFNASNEKRFVLLAKQNEDTLKHHDAFVIKAHADRTQSEADRKEYIARLENLMKELAQERILISEQMVKGQSDNTAAINMNTRAREAASIELEKLMKEVAGTVIVKLNELGFLVPPARNASAKRKLVRARPAK